MSWKKLFCNYLIYQEHLAMDLKDPKESAKGKDFHTHQETNSIQKWAMDLIDIFPKKKYANGN